MRNDPVTGLAVETAAPGVRLVRVTGRLDRQGAEAIGRMIDAQRACGTAPAHVVLDLGGVSEFDGAATEELGGVAARSREDGVRVHLAGCGGRAELLPLRAHRVLLRCSAFPSAEAAVRELTAHARVPRPRDRVAGVAPTG
ncbi:STAS domain-containing protein [Pseudonocardia sp. NPDC049635]|uniref:STAS domain-containing protein n=1 Tax=Pseudonocardia sp. NPDC049635 TaxID=3155506 RepID=UPI0033F8640D